MWFASPLTIRFEEQPATNFIDWLKDTLTQAQQDCIELISTLCYQIWKARNLLIFQQKHIPVLEFIDQAITSIYESKQH
jgi:hypothetical protein